MGNILLNLSLFLLLLCCVSTEFVDVNEYVYEGSFTTHDSAISCWTPNVAGCSECAVVGGVCIPFSFSFNNSFPSPPLFPVPVWNGSSSLSQYPLRYRRVWENNDKSASLWRPLCPKGYKTVGHIAVQGLHKPPVTMMKCIANDLEEPFSVSNISAPLIINNPVKETHLVMIQKQKSPFFVTSIKKNSSRQKKRGEDANGEECVLNFAYYDTPSDEKCKGSNDGSIEIEYEDDYDEEDPVEFTVTVSVKEVGDITDVAEKGISLISDLPPDTYSVKITDSDGCVETIQMEVKASNIVLIQKYDKLSDDSYFSFGEGQVKIQNTPDQKFSIGFNGAKPDYSKEALDYTFSKGGPQIEYTMGWSGCEKSYTINVDTAPSEDPIIKYQWHIKNSWNGGEDSIGLQAAWNSNGQEISGKGIVIAIVDHGVADLKSIDGYNELNFLGDGFSNSFYPGRTGYAYSGPCWTISGRPVCESHGTQCATIAAGKKNNYCGRGVAYGAQVLSLNTRRNDDLSSDPINGFEFEKGILISSLNKVDIYSNSWGYSGIGLHRYYINDMETGATTGRCDENGKNCLGAIYVRAAGNFKKNGNGCQYNSLNSGSQYIILVGAVYDERKSSLYSCACSGVLISAPSGKDDDISSIITPVVEIQNENPVIRCPSMNNDQYATKQVVGGFTGTSLSTPIVSGVIALVLQVNPKLNWRQVQHLLVQTADKALDSTGNVYTKHDPETGHGIVNADKAVKLALEWPSGGPADLAAALETKHTASGRALNPSQAEISIEIDQDFLADNIILSFSTHYKLQDITITLTRPPCVSTNNDKYPTQVILSKPEWSNAINYLPKDPSTNDYILLPIRTVAFWGMRTKGTWKLSAVINTPGVAQGDRYLIKDWKMDIYGYDFIAGINSPSDDNGCFVATRPCQSLPLPPILGQTKKKRSIVNSC